MTKKDEKSPEQIVQDARRRLASFAHAGDEWWFTLPALASALAPRDCDADLELRTAVREAVDLQIGLLNQKLRRAGRSGLTPSSERSFAQKLLERRGDDTPIGDLASDAYADKQFPREGNAEQVEIYLASRACPDAMRAFRMFRRSLSVR